MVDIKIKINSTLQLLIIILTNLHRTNGESCNWIFDPEHRSFRIDGRVRPDEILNCKNATKETLEQYYNINPQKDCNDTDDGYRYILSITNSNISSIDSSTFKVKSLCQLYEVRMTNSNIQNIQPNTFTNFTQIRKLNLENNKITEVSFLQGLSNLTELYLEHNILKQMKTTDFVHLDQLRRLHLAFNKLEFIDNKVFATLNKLTYLHLNDNNIKNVDEAAFKTLKNLVVLNLGYNKITNLKVKSFEGLSSLYKLSLNNNYLVNISVGIFNGLEKLHELNLANNKISSLNPELFSGLKSLLYLYLNDNMIKQIPLGTLKHFPKLRRLHLGSNYLSQFKIGSFSNLHELRHLNLSHNNFSVLNEIVLYPLTYLEDLNLDNNNFSYINYTSLLLHLPNLQWITVNDNNWNCSLLTDMLSTFRAKKVHYIRYATSRHNKENVDGIYCIETDQNVSKFRNISTPQTQADLFNVKNATDILLNAINENTKATRNITFDYFTKISFLQMQADYTRDLFKNTSKAIRENMDLLSHNMAQYLQNSENRNISSNFGLHMINTLIFLSTLTISFLLSFIVYKKYFKNIRMSRTKQIHSEIELLSATS